jgi:hypothetical protein
VQVLSNVVRGNEGPLRLVIALNAPQRVVVRVFDARGRLVRTLVNETRSGDVEIAWNGAPAENGVPRAGVYSVHVTVGGRTERHAVVVVP